MINTFILSFRSYSIISDILGHSDPGIVKHYIKVNRNGLKKCVLEVEVKKNVK